MGKDLGSQLKAFTECVFHQECAVRKVAEPYLWHDRFARASVQEPMSDILLQPEGNFVPDLSHAQSPVRVSCRDLEHSEGADLWNVFRFLDEGDLGAQFR